MSGKAVPGPASPAGTTFSAHRAPIQHDEIAGLDRRDVRPDFVYYARGLVSEKKRKFVANAALAVVQIGVADTARLGADDDLTRPRIRHHYSYQRYWLPLGHRNDSLDLQCHRVLLVDFGVIV